MPFRRPTDILPTGADDKDPLLGLQERNQRNLLDVLQAATPIIEEMAKVKPETWRSMKGLFTSLESSFGTGVKTLGQGFLAPFNQMQGRIMNMTEGFLAPVMVGINNLGNQIESMAMANPTGATIGAGIGFIAGFWLPGGNILWSMVGAGVGAAFESQLASGDLTIGLPEIGDTGYFQAFGGGPIIGGGNQNVAPPLQTSATGGDIIPQDVYGSVSRPGGQFGDRIGRMEQFG